MATTEFPRRLDPLKLADQGASLSGSIAVSSLPRVLELLGSDHSEVIISLSFYRDKEYRCVIDGTLRLRAQVTCERCLKLFEQDIHSEFKLCVVASDEAAQDIPRNYDPLVVEEQFVDVADVIEDEVLLALPMFSYHADSDCDASIAALIASDTETVEPKTSEEKVNPFKVLSTLKLKK